MFRSLCLAAALCAAPIGALADTITVSFDRTDLPGSPINWKILQPWMYAIEYATEGRVRFELSPTSASNPENRYSEVQEGDIEATFLFNGYLTESHPLLQLSMMPMTSQSAEASAVALWEVYQSDFSAIEPFEDVVLLGFLAAPPTQIWSLEVDKLETIADFDLARLYAPAGMEAEAARMLGAIPLSPGVSELRSTINSGVYSGLFSVSIADALTIGIFDDVTGLTYVPGGMFTPTYSVVLSQDIWRQISPEDQASILALSGRALAERSRLWDIEENAARIAAEERGVDIMQADLLFEAELQGRMKQSIWDVWLRQAAISGVNGVSALNSYLEKVDTISAARKKS